MNYRILVSAVLIGVLWACPGRSAEGDGGYAGAFFQVPAGARPTAMGGAYLAVSDDGAAPLFNPAGLANLKRPLVGSSYRAMKLDRSLGYITVMFPVQGSAVVGAHWLYAGSGSVEARDSDGDLLGRDISNNNHQFAAVFAKRFERYLAFGINLGYLYSTMPEINAASVGFDFGLMFYVDQLFDREKREELPVKDIQVGLTFKNVSKRYSWNSETYLAKYTTNATGSERDDDVPLEFGLGAAGRFADRRLLLAADVLKNEKQGTQLHAGAEFYVSEEFALRSGYSDGRFTAGTGYMFRLGSRVLLIDYAFTTDKADEGSEHIFSFDVQF
ncbi:MAG TPA: PorV/PorQ family protein [Acidobacteriota bacterium]|nr:PorV/PorQ family protein [Acidobacteriota bacterium]